MNITDAFAAAAKQLFSMTYEQATAAILNGEMGIADRQKLNELTRALMSLPEIDE